MCPARSNFLAVRHSVKEFDAGERASVLKRLITSLGWGQNPDPLLK